MEELLRIFIDRLRARPEPPFNPGAWEALSARLEQNHNAQSLSSRHWKTVSLLLFSLLLLSNAWQGFSLYRMSQRAKQSAEVNLIPQRDTVYCTEWILRQDTQYIVREIYNSPKDSSIPEEEIVKHINSDFSNEDSLIFKQSSDRHIFVDSIVYVNANINNQMGLSLDSISSDWLLPDLFNVYSEKKGLQIDWSKAIEIIKPEDVLLGIGGGGFGTLHTEVVPLLGNMKQVMTQVQYGNGLRIQLGAAWLNNPYETGSSLTGIPYIEPPAEQFAFLKAEVPARSFQYSLGLQYVLGQHQRIRPILGFSLIRNRALPYEVVYEFKNILTASEYYQDVSIPKDKHYTTMLGLQAGIEYHFAKRLMSRLELSYQKPINSSSSKASHTLGIQAGIFYKLNKNR